MSGVCVGRKKIFGIKATGSNSFHRCGGPPPSRREVWGASPVKAYVLAVDWI